MTAILPILAVLATALVVLALDTVLAAESDLRPHLAIGLIGLGSAGWLTLRAWSGDLSVVAGSPVRGSSTSLVVADGMAIFTWGLLIAAATLTLLAGIDYAQRREMARGELVILVLLATAGMMLLAAANDLVLLFLALETFSLGLYVLAGFRPGVASSQEAALKYFVLGSFSAAILLYGASLLFATFGTTNLGQLGASLSSIIMPVIESGARATQPEAVRWADALARVPASAWTGFALVLVALGFKVALAPFHQWTPDVYQGAPAPVTGFMAAATKAAAFAALIRVLWVGFPLLDRVWVPLVGVLAVLTMLVGNLLGLVQGDLKRMLGFSAVAHAGYMAVAVVAGPPAGVMAAIFYALVYGLANLGAFAVLAALPAKDGDRDPTELEDLRGLARTHPGLALALALHLLSLTGLPPTAGFLGKWYIFRASVQAGQTPLAVVLVVASVVSAFYYIRPVVFMYVGEPKDAARWSVGTPSAIVVGVTTLVVGLAIVLASPLAYAAQAAGEPGRAPSASTGAAPPERPSLFFSPPSFEKRPAP